MVTGAPGGIVVICTGRFNPEQFPDRSDVASTVAIAEETVVSDAVLASWQDVDKEAANELTCCQRHGGVAASAFDAVIFDTKGDVIGIGSDQTAVGNRDPMGVAGQICQYSFGSSKRFLCINDPVDFAERLKEGVEGISIGEVSVITEGAQLPGFVQLAQPVQNEPPVQTGQHPDGQEEVLAAGNPLGAIGRQASARHDHMDVWVVRHY